MADINCNINRQPHEMVSNDKACLFTLRHLKAGFPRYFIDEDTTYFFKRNGLLAVMHVFGKDCIPCENTDEYSLNHIRIRPDFIHRYYEANTMLIRNIIDTIHERSSLEIYFTWKKENTLLDAHDKSQYKCHPVRIYVAGAPSEYFEAFTSWLREHVPEVFIATETIRT